MSLGDGEKNKDIRKRANDFLSYGVLGCCPGVKALGKTVADKNSEKQPEKALPNVENNDGYRFDPSGKWEPGMMLSLFPNSSSRGAINGKPNFGWVPEMPAMTQDQTDQSFAEKLKKLADGPRVVQEVWEVDDSGNPTKLVQTDDPDAQNTESDIKEKGLGRTLREMNPGNTLIARAAKRFGVWVDDLGKFRCPPGTPNANQFTDEFGSTCFAVSASQIANAAQEGFASLGAWWKRRQQSKLPFYIDEFGNVTENTDIISGRQEYRRVFTGSRARVRQRMQELEDNVNDLLRIHGITPSSDSNDDLIALIEKLNPELKGKFITFRDSTMMNLTPEQQQKLRNLGISGPNIKDSERGFLMKIAEMALTDRDRFLRLGLVQAQTIKMPDGSVSEAITFVANPDAPLGDVRYTIKYDPIEMAINAKSQVLEVLDHQRLGLRTTGTASDEEAADLLHQFVINETQWAGGMTASLGKNPFMAKGTHTAIHEIAHTIQVDKMIEKVREQKGSSARLSKLTNREIFNLMRDVGDDIDMEDLGLAVSDLDRVAFLGGRYGAQEYGRSGAVNELWRIEATAELYALREMGVIEGDDVDRALEFMDSMKGTRSREMREAGKKKNRKIVEREAAKRRPADVPGAKTTSKPRRAKPVKSPKSAAKLGDSILERSSTKLDSDEIEALERIGDPRSKQVISLVDPKDSANAIKSIDSGYRLARKHGADLDEIDVTDSSAVERVAYDPKRKRLYVTYRGKDGESGRSYYYRKVDEEVVLELHKSKSKGKSINEIKRTHEAIDVDVIPEKVNKKNPDEGDIASQVQFNLIPTLTALDKSQVGEDMRVVISVDATKTGGEIEDVKGITTARIYHDGISLNPGEVVLSIPADARGIPVKANDFDREETGTNSLLMMPPMKVAIITDKQGQRAELVDQEFSNTTLTRMLDEWPAGSDAKDGRLFNSSRNRAEEIIASHMAMGEGSGMLPDGSTTPMSARRIRTRNADVFDRHTSKRSATTRPTKSYRDSISTGRTGFSSMGKIETPEERSFGRMYGHTENLPSLRNDASIDPEVRRIIKDAGDREVSQMIDAAAADFHEGIDRRPRLRVSDDELSKVISDGGRSFSDRGHYSAAERNYQALYGVHPDVDDIDRPVSGYVVHPAQDKAARDAMRRRGVQVGDAPIEWPSQSNPHGDVDADGDIEIVLKPEVSGRTAYGFGYGIDEKTRPVWMNSSDSSDISDALVHVDTVNDPDAAKMRMVNALSALVDGNYGYFTDVSSVKPAATSQNEKTEDFIKRVGDHAKNSKPQRLGAQIMGGFVNEEIAEIRYPWSKVSKSSSDVDISDVVNKEPISDRLRRLGFTDAEIEYFYKVNGERSLDYISSATMASLKDYRKAMEIKKDYEARGIPMVSFAHPNGIDPLDISSYAADPNPSTTIEGALAKAINEEVDELIEKMLKQVRKTRGKLWEMRPKAGART